MITTHKCKSEVGDIKKYFIKYEFDFVISNIF